MMLIPLGLLIPLGVLRWEVFPSFFSSQEVQSRDFDCCSQTKVKEIPALYIKLASVGGIFTVKCPWVYTHWVYPLLEAMNH